VQFRTPPGRCHLESPRRTSENGSLHRQGNALRPMPGDTLKFKLNCRTIDVVCLPTPPGPDRRSFPRSLRKLPNRDPVVAFVRTLLGPSLSVPLIPSHEAARDDNVYLVPRAGTIGLCLRVHRRTVRSGLYDQPFGTPPAWLPRSPPRRQVDLRKRIAAVGRSGRADPRSWCYAPIRREGRAR
jgi:hypothetical protein